MKSARKVGKIIMTIISEGIPCLCFVILFVSFFSTIIARYFFRTSLNWSNEVSVLCYMYCMFFGSGLALHTDSHVVFSLVYDKMSNKGKMIFRVLNNAIIVVLLAVAIGPCYTAISSSKSVTGVLKMPFSIVFMPFVWFMAEMIVRCILEIKRVITAYKNGTLDMTPEQLEAEAEKEVNA